MLLDPKDAGALSNLGVAYRQTNKIDEAQKYFQKSLELKPDSADSHFNLGVVYRRKKMTQEAIWRVPEGDPASTAGSPMRTTTSASCWRSRSATTRRSREWNAYLDLKGQQNPKDADIVRKHIKELGGTPR